MNKKRKHDDKEHLLKKLRKIEKKIQKLVSDDEESECSEVEDALPPSHWSPQVLELPILEQNIPELNSPTRDGSPINVEDDDDALDESILEILGSVQAEPKGSTLHKAIVSRWTEILSNGLKKEEKEILTKDNLPFENCPELCAPKLNPEVKAALPESARKRDQIIENKQRQISTVLSCLGSALQACINGSDTKEVLGKINQASRLLCDTFYLDSRNRRSLILFSINKDMKESLLQTKPQEYLFGNDLSEQIKTAKTVQKSVQDLKVTQKTNNIGNRVTDNSTLKNNTRSLNWRGPPRQRVRTQKPASGGAAYGGGGGRFQQRKKDERSHERQPQERQPLRNVRR